MSKRRRNTITIASDDRARVPFAVVGVLLLVTSVAVVAVRQTQPPSTSEEATSMSEALRQTESLSRTAVQDATKRALKEAARKPVTRPADGPAGQAFAAEFDGDLDESPYAYDQHVFRRYTKLRIYLAAQRQLAATSQRFEGDVRTRASVPDVDYSEESLRNAIDRVEFTAGMESDDDDVPTGEVDVVVHDVRVTVWKNGEKQVRERDVSMTVPSTTFALHERTVKYEEQLNEGFFDADGYEGLGRRLAARLYPLAYAKASYERVRGTPNPAPSKRIAFNSMVENYETEVLANDAIFNVQRNVYGTSDGAAQNVMASGYLCLVARTGSKLGNVDTKLKNRSGFEPKQLCQMTNYVLGGASGETKSIEDAITRIMDSTSADDRVDESVDRKVSIELKRFANPAYQWAVMGYYNWSKHGSEVDEVPNRDTDAVQGDDELETPQSEFDRPVTKKVLERIYTVDVTSSVDATSTGTSTPSVSEPSFTDAENWTVSDDEVDTTEESVDAEKRRLYGGGSDSSSQRLHRVTVTVEKSFERTKTWTYEGPRNLSDTTKERTATSSATYEVTVTTRASHSSGSLIANKGVSSVYSGGSAPAGQPRAYFGHVPEKALRTVLTVSDASSVESDLESISLSAVESTDALEDEVLSGQDGFSEDWKDLLDSQSEREDARAWLREQIAATNDRLNTTDAAWKRLRVSRIKMATSDDVFSSLKGNLTDRQPGIVYRNARSGYESMGEKARAEIRLVYVRQMKHWMDEVEEARKDARGNVDANISEKVGQADGALTEGLSFANDVLDSDRGPLGASPPGTIGKSDIYDEVTFRVESAPAYLSTTPVSRNTVPEVRPKGETIGDPENTYHASMAARNNMMLPNPGAPVVPWPSFWYVSVNNVNVRVKGEYARFTATAHTGGPSSASATTYVRQPQPVTLKIDGLRHRVGRVEAVNFTSLTAVVLAMPGGTVMPSGSMGVGDRMYVNKVGKHELTECSTTWPHVGPGFTPDKQDPSKCGNIANGSASTPAGMSELLLAGASGELDDVDDVVLDEEFTNACDRPTGDDDAVRPAGRVSPGPTDRFANVEQLSLGLDDDDDEEAGCPDEQLEVTFIDVGKGNAVLFEYQNDEGESETLLYDAGAAVPTDYDEDVAAEITAATDGDDGTIDHLVISHNHSDHINLVGRLVNGHDIGVEDVYVSGVNARDEDELNRGEEAMQEVLNSETDAEVHVVTEGDTITSGPMVARVLRPETSEGTAADAKSVVLSVDYAQATFLLTGDLRHPQEEDLVESQYLRRVDVLLASHHGSAAEGETVVSEPFLAATTPKSVVISNDNDPEAESDERRVPNCGVFQRLESNDVSTYWTAIHGDVTYKVTRTGLLIGPHDGPTGAEALAEESEKDCGSLESESVTRIPDRIVSRVRTAHKATQIRATAARV